MQLTEQDNKSVELGLAAEKLLSDQFFTFVMSELGNAYVGQIVQSKSEQTTEREGFYHAIKALQDVTATLSHWVQVKEHLMQSLEDQTDEQE